MLDQALRERNLPDLWPDSPAKPSLADWEKRRQQLVKLLQDHVYGTPMPPPQSWHSQILSENTTAFASKATHRKIQLNLDLPAGRFSFPVDYLHPNHLCRQAQGDESCPFFVHIAFQPQIPDAYLPAEEIIDQGFALFNFCYEDIVADRRDVLDEGLPAYHSAKDQEEKDWGKIAMWAWAACRVMDYAEAVSGQGSGLDLKRATVVGHSRLGKTALLAGALDPRFRVVISNDSGCAGAALERGGSGEDTAKICQTFPDWFNRVYPRYAGRADAMPFDQHFLLAAIAPRTVYVASAVQDAWADPDSEFLSAYAAGKLYEKLGLPGLITPDTMPTDDCQLSEGKVVYHRRPGTHFLSRTDWQRFMQCLHSYSCHLS